MRVDDPLGFELQTYKPIQLYVALGEKSNMEPARLELTGTNSSPIDNVLAKRKKNL